MSFSLLSNSPVSGQIAWSDVRLVYDGVDYAIANGTTNKRFVYWLISAPTVFQTADTLPALGPDDTIVFLNKNGIAINVLNATALEGDLVVPGTVTSAAIATDAIDASHIKSNAIVGRHILAGEITADKLTVTNLAAISANMGDITSGSLTIDQTGFIRGGATAYGTGTGFWMGYHSGKYKFRAGTPGSSGFEWNGDGFYVYGPDGSVTIASGVVDWDKIAGADKPESGATRNAYRGGWTLGTAHKKGDIVIKDGSGWIAKLDHTADALNMPPTLPTDSNTYWGLYAAKGDTGDQPVTSLLTNEAVTLAANSSGTVTAPDFTNYAKGVFRVYSGHELVTPAAVVYSVVTQTGCTGTIDASGNYSVSAMSADTAALVLQAVWNGVTIQRTFALSKSRAGATGSSATAYSLTVSSQAIKRDAQGVYSEPTITLTAYSKTGTSAIAAYAGRFKISTSSDGVAFTASYTSSANQSSYTYTIPTGVKVIRCELFLAGGTTTLLDSENVVVVEDGKDASYVSYVFRESATPPATPTGTAIVPVDWLDAPPASPASPVWMSKATVDGVTNLAGVWSVPIRVTGTDGQSTQFQYAKNTSVSTAPTAGWSDTAPTLSAGEYLWMRSGTVVPPATTPSTWGAGYRISGEAGASAPLLRVRADSQVFRIAKSGTATPTSVTLNADLQNLTGNATFSITGGTLTGTGNARTLTYANMTADTAVITVTHSGLTDKITVVKVHEGADGTGVTIKGSFATAGELPASGNLAGDAYLVAGYLYVWTGSAWNNVGLIQGPKGDDGADGIEGTPALSGFLTNEAQVLAANVSGTVASFAEATGTFKVFLGTTDITTGNGVAYSVVTQSGCTGSINATTGVYSVTAMSADTATLTLKAVIGLAEVVKAFSLSKSKTGATGSSAKLAVLTASSQIFQVSKLGVATPTSVTLTAYGQNLAGSPTFSVSAGTATLTGTGNGRALAYSGLTTDSATIKIVWDGQEDYITVAKVREGSDGTNGINGINGINGTNGLDGLTVIVSNESHTVPASAAGAVSSYTNSGTTIQVYEGINALTAASSATANGSFTIDTPVIAPAAKITVGARTYSGTTATVAAHSAMDGATDSVTITYPLTIKRLDGSTVAVNRTQTITKSKTGAAGANSIVAILSNESHVVPADNAGVVQSLSGATTTMTIYNGSSDDSANWTYSVTKTGVTCADVATSRTQTITGMSADVGYVDFTASRSGYANVTKRFTITKSKAGNVGDQGAMGPTVSINPNRAATFTATDNVVDASQSNIVFTATTTGLASPTYAWSFSRLDGSGTTPTASTTSTYTVTQANFGTSKAVTVTCTVNGTYTDTYTIVLLNRSTAAAGATVGATTEELAKLESLAKAGANLVSNSAFASTIGGNMAPGWVLYNNGAVANVQWWYRGGGMFGTDAQRVKTLAATTDTFGVWTSFAAGGGVRYVPGWGHYISFYARAVGGEPGFAGLTMSGLANNNLWTSTQDIENPPLLNDVYQRYVFYGVANAGSDLTAGALWITANGSKPANASLDICCVQVEAAVSGAATAWKPSYYDTIGAGRPITTSNVTTYIANAAIGNAQIGGDIYSSNWSGWGGAGWLLQRSGNFYGNNIYARGNIEASSLKANTAMVNTLHIAGGAVTIPIHAFTAGAVSGTAAGAWVSLQTVTINPEGGRASIVATATVLKPVSTGGDISSIQVRLLQAGSAVLTTTAALSTYGKGSDGGGNPLYSGGGAICLSYMGDVFSSNVTYELQAYLTSTIQVSGRSILAIGSKR